MSRISFVFNPTASKIQSTHNTPNPIVKRKSKDLEGHGQTPQISKVAKKILFPALPNNRK
jgi:hypothetical protein